MIPAEFCYLAEFVGGPYDNMSAILTHAPTDAAAYMIVSADEDGPEARYDRHIRPDGADVWHYHEPPCSP